MLMMMPPLLRYFWFHSIYSLAASCSLQSAVCTLQMSYTTDALLLKVIYGVATSVMLGDSQSMQASQLMLRLL